MPNFFHESTEEQVKSVHDYDSDTEQVVTRCVESVLSEPDADTDSSDLYSGDSLNYVSSQTSEQASDQQISPYSQLPEIGAWSTDTDSSNWDSEDSSSYVSSSDNDIYPCPDFDSSSVGKRYSQLKYEENIIRKKDSFSLAKIKLNAIEIEKYESIWQKIDEIHSDLGKADCEDDYIRCEERFNEVISQALKQGVMFTFPYRDNVSFIDFIIGTLQKIYQSYDSTQIYEFIYEKKISQIMSGGATLNKFTQEKYEDYVNIICADEDILSQWDKNISKLYDLAFESVVNKSKQIDEYDFKAEIDNGYFCIEYPQDSIIEVTKILNNEEAKDLNLSIGILKVGESIIRVENIGGKRNYTDVLESNIEMSFTTEVGKISICLRPHKEDSNKIKVELDEESQANFNKLKNKSSLGESCLLGGKSVLQAVKDKSFERGSSVSIESTWATKQSNDSVDAPSTIMKRVNSLDQLQKKKERACGG